MLSGAVVVLALLGFAEAKAILSDLNVKENACSFEAPDYSLSWTYEDLSSDVVFKLTTKSSHTNFWSGVYFGNEDPTDAIGIFVRAGQIGIMDGHVTTDGVEADNVTNVQSLSFDLQNGLLTAEFARPLSTSDDVDLAECTTFFFPTKAPEIDQGGPIDIPKEMPQKRVCDLAASCLVRSQAAVVKRADAPVCEYSNNGNTVSWRKKNKNYIFTFDIEARAGPWWSAVGTGESMENLPLLVAFTEDGKVKSSGGFKSSGYATPKKDNKAAPNSKLLSSTVDGEKAHFELAVGQGFINKAKTGDCVTLQVAILSGNYKHTGKNYQIKKHDDTPVAVTVCGIEQCDEKSEVQDAVDEQATSEDVVDHDAAVMPEEPEASENPESEPEPEVQPAEAEPTTTPLPAVAEPMAEMHIEQPLEGDQNAALQLAEGSGEEPKDEESTDVEGSGDASEREEKPNVAEARPESDVNPLTGDEASNIMKSVDGAEPSESANNGTATDGENAENSEVPKVDGDVSPGATGEEIANAVCQTEDIRVCDGYFAEYLNKVKDWSEKHNHTLESQMWKACKLLSQVKYVPTLCCNRFQKECGSSAHVVVV